MKKGDILYHTEFKFPDGTTSDKLLVILNTPDPIKEPFLVCTTTSQSRNKPKTPGCHSKESLFFIKANHDFFNKDTWLQFYQLYELDFKKLLKTKFDGLVKISGSLKEQTINEVINCIRKSDDVSEYYLKLIGKRGQS